MDNIFDLQRFADGAAGADGGSGQAATGAEAQTAENRPLATGKRKPNPLANVQYGRQDGAQTDAAMQQGQESPAAEESFEDLIKGRFKQDFDNRVQGIIQDRLRSSKARQTASDQVLEKIAQRYGIDTSDMSKLDFNALNEKIDGDLSQYEEEALEKGLPAETVKRIHDLERFEAKQRAQREQAEADAAIRSHLDSLVQQEQQLKQLYPNFDLMTELQNPAFVRLTAPNTGVDVRTAYEVVHRDEMRGAEMQFAAQKAAQRISASVQANGRRPAENGINASAAAEVKTDPTKLTKADREEIRRRVRLGEKISF